MLLQPQTELDALEKLAQTDHLSTPERKLLPAGAVRLSQLRLAIERAAQRDGQFPRRAEPDGAHDGGILIVRPGEPIRLVWRHEVSLYRFQTVRIDEYPELGVAVMAFILGHWPGRIDGIPINVSA